MGVNNKPQDDAKAMLDEYNKGVTIASLALKYNHSEQEVFEVVTKEADVAELTTQAAEDNKPATADKKGK